MIKLKKDAPALVILNNLYKRTPLQTNFAVNTVALVDGVPRTLNLRPGPAGLHRPPGRGHHPAVRVPPRRRPRPASPHRRGPAQGPRHDRRDHRPHPGVGGPGRGPRGRSWASRFEFTEIQANHILDMQLGRLTRLGRTDLEEELAELRATIAELEAILADEGKLRDRSSRTSWARSATSTPRTAAPRSPTTRRDRPRGPHRRRGPRRHHDAPRATSRPSRPTPSAPRAAAAGAWPGPSCATRTTSPRSSTPRRTPTCCSSRTAGKVYRLKAHEIPMKDRTARGTAIVNLLPLQPDEKIQAIIDTRDYETNRFLFFATRTARSRRPSSPSTTRRCAPASSPSTCKDGDELVRVIPTNGDDDIFLVARSGRPSASARTMVRPMGRAAAGVRGMKLREGDEVVSCDGQRATTPTSSRHRRRLRQAHQDRQVPAQGRGGPWASRASR